jgi:hypothetical protein
VLLLPLISIGARLASERRWRTEYEFCAYLVLSALLSCAGYILGAAGKSGWEG